jgi:cobalt-zinc-cadmium efflux system membrane fusion protein
MNRQMMIAVIAALIVGFGCGAAATYLTVRTADPTALRAPQGAPAGTNSDRHDGEHDGGEHGDHGHDPSRDRKGAEDAVRLTQKQVDELGIEVKAAGPGSLYFSVRLPGEVVLNPDSMAHIVARAPGVARKINKRVGDMAQAGEVLAVLDSAELATAKVDYLAKQKAMELARIDLVRTRTVHDNTRKMLELTKEFPGLEALRELEGLDLGANRSDLISAYAELSASKAEYERQQRLLGDNIASEADFQAAQSNYQKANATYQSVRDDMTFNNRRTLDERTRAFTVAEFEFKSADPQLHVLGLSEADIQGIQAETKHELSRSEIRALISGVVIERHIVLGEMIGDDDAPFLIADLSNVWANLTVYQKDLVLVRAGQPVTISCGQGIPNAAATIDYVSPLVDEETRTATARVVLDNPGGHYRPGLFVTAQVQVDEKQVPILVPKEALQTVEGRSVLFVETDEGFELRPVAIGRSDDTNVEITAGLKPGERFVTANAFTLKSELAKAGFEAGHGH